MLESEINTNLSYPDELFKHNLTELSSNIIIDAYVKYNYGANSNKLISSIPIKNIIPYFVKLILNKKWHEYYNEYHNQNHDYNTCNESINLILKYNFVKSVYHILMLVDSIIDSIISLDLFERLINESRTISDEMKQQEFLHRALYTIINDVVSCNSNISKLQDILTSFDSSDGSLVEYNNKDIFTFLI